MPENISNFDKSAAKIKVAMTKSKGELHTNVSKEDEGKGLMSTSQMKSNILTDMKEAVLQMDAIRRGGANVRSVDLSLEAFVKSKFGFGSVDAFYQVLGLNPAMHTVESLSTMPEFNDGFRWLVPEIIREAIRLGLRRNPIHPSLIAGEETVTQTSVIMPSVNMSAAIPKKINEAETIPTGSVSFNQKTVKLSKIGTGLKMSDEVVKYVSLNILSLYLQDAGVQLGLGLDAMAIDTLINGDDDAGSNAAPVIGVETVVDGITYFDLLRAWVRMGRLGRLPSGLISNEAAALSIFQMAEFKGANYNNKKQDLNIKTPIPQSQDFYVHGSMPSDGSLGFIDRTAALIKLNASGLMVESERIAERQLSGTYVTQTTGFAKLFNDAFVVMDPDLAFSAAGFPASMDVDKAEAVVIS